MKLRFWRREKKFESIDRIVGTETTKVYDDDLETIIAVDYANKDPIVEIYEGVITEPIATADEVQENQCLGTAKKTGKPCNRTTPLGYCWQHKNQRGVE